MHVILHIGMPKTGSTALQRNLADHRAILREHAVVYPRLRHLPHAHHALMPLFERPGAIWGRVKKALGPDPAAAASREWEAVLEQMRDPRPKVMVLSTEALFVAFEPRRLAAFAERILAVAERCTLVAYVRAPARFYASILIERAKRTTRPRDAGPIDYRAPIEQLQRALGAEVIVRPFERASLHRGDISHDFLWHALGLDLPDLPAVVGNVSLSPETASVYQAIMSHKAASHRWQFGDAETQLVRSLRAIEQAIGQSSTGLRPEVARHVTCASKDVLWLREAFDVVFPDIDYDALRDHAPSPGLRVRGLRDAFAFDEAYHGEVLEAVWGRHPELRDCLPKRSRTLAAPGAVAVAPVATAAAAGAARAPRQAPADLYRFGFLVTCDGGAAASPNDRWRRMAVGGLTLLLHPETQIRHLDTPTGHAVVLGPVFAVGPMDVEGILARLINDAGPGVEDALCALSGRFCLIVQTTAGTQVYGDPIGARSLFYDRGAQRSVASHAALLADHLGAARSPRAEAFVRTDKYNSLKVKYLPGDMTMYDEILALVPNHSLTLGEGDGPQRYWPVRPRSEVEPDALAARCEAYFGALAQSLEGRTTFIGVTGGIDTRLLHAGLSRFGVAPRGMTWLGVYLDPKERPVIEGIVERMGLAHGYVAMPGPKDEVAALARRNAGGYRGASRLTSAIAQQVEGARGAVFLRGYGGEVMRGFYRLGRGPLRDGSAEELYRVYAARAAIEEPDPIFDAMAQAAFESFAERARYDDAVARLGYDVNDFFYWEHRMGTWGAAMHNELDPAMESMTGLNDRGMFDLAARLPDEVRLTKSLFVDLVRSLEPRLGDFPIV